MEGLLGRPRPVVVRLASDDRVQRSDHVGWVGATQAAQLLGEPLPDLFQRGAAGFGEHLGAAAEVVAADREGQEIEPGVDASDSRLLLVQGKTPFLQPGIQSGGDRLGLLAAVAQRHEIVRIGDDGRVPGLDSAAVVVFDTRSCLHSLQRDIKQQRRNHPALRGSLLGG